MSEQMSITQIKVAENPRKDFGNIEELASSIKAQGVIQPLIVRKNGKEYELVAGERRLKAATMAGLKEVPVRVIENDDPAEIAEIKLVENIQRKDMTPYEEGQAFSAYLKATKQNVEYLAAQIGHKPTYVEGRLLMLNLGAEGRKALEQGKIQLGHGKILANLGPTQQKECVDLIIEEKLTVQDLADQLRWNKKINWDKIGENIQFKKAESLTKQKSIFESIGADLEVDGYNYGEDVTQLASMKKELLEYVKAERERLQKLGIKVYASQEDLKKTWPDAVSLRNWDPEYKTAITKLAGSNTYGLVVDMEDNDLQKEVYRLVKPVSKAKAEEKPSPAAVKEAEEKLLKSRKQKLEEGVRVLKITWLTEQAQAHAEKQGKEHQLKALALYALLQSADMELEPREVLAAVGIKERGFSVDGHMKDLLKLTDKQLDQAFQLAGKQYIDSMQSDDLAAISTGLGTKLTDYTVTEEYLELHTIDQLTALAKELKIKTESTKKGDLVKDILAAKPKATPKLFTTVEV